MASIVWKRFKGAFFLTLVILIWVASAVLIQVIFNSPDTEFNKPLFLTYFSTSFFTLYLIPLPFELCKLKDKRFTPEEVEEQRNALGDSFLEETPLQRLKQELREIVKLSLTFCALWFGSNYFYNYGLQSASVTSSVVLSNTSPMWVYLISISCVIPRIHREEFRLVKGLMVVVSIAGFSLIAYQDAQTQEGSDTGVHSLLSDSFTLMSAMCYGLYATFLKIKVPEEKEDDFRFTYFLGFVGLINDIVLLPVIVLFNYTGIETFQWPNQQAALLLSVNALIGTVLSDYCWARSVVLLGPLITTLGITLTFPISLAFDICFNGKVFSLVYLIGSALIFAAFGVITYSDYTENQKKKDVSPNNESKLLDSDTEENMINLTRSSNTEHESSTRQ